MRRERVSDDIYVFTSDLYAQVTATAVVTTEGIVSVDTLPFPEETRAMVAFLKGLGRGPIRYLINTHWHGDHTNGNFLFGNVQLVCHQLCAQRMLEVVKLKAGQARDRQSSEEEELPIRVPDITFDEGEMCFHLGGKSLHLIPTPGHTPDSIVVYIREDKVLLAADTMMPLPYFVGGSYRDFLASLESLLQLNIDTIVQGHGEVLLRGEVKEAIQSNIRYLTTIQKRLAELIESGQNIEETLRRLDIESCGKSRISLNGMVQDLHYANLRALYQEMSQANDSSVVPDRQLHQRV
ncbi:MAG: MBL fold metallo-hydrolase [Anaerolineae bacterium]